MTDTQDTSLEEFEQIFADPMVEEIWMNSGAQIYCSRHGDTELTNVILSQTQVENLVERLLLSSGRRVDFSTPFVDATLVNGSRLHVTIPPITDGIWAVNIRKHKARARQIKDLIALRMLGEAAAQFLAKAVGRGCNIVVSGPTQAGKTTTVRALCGEIPSGQRIVTCEEVFELAITARDIVAMQTRGPSLDGKGEITLRRLVTEALRMRPDRLIIGEVRGAETLDMLIGLNCGVPGMTTIHANNASQALNKLCTLPLLGASNVTDGFIAPTVAQTIDIIVQLAPSPNRCITQILGLTGIYQDSLIQTMELFTGSGLELKPTAKIDDFWSIRGIKDRS